MAHVHLHHSLSRAHNILRALNASGKLPKRVAARFSAETWDNCREQGLCLQGGWFVEADAALELPRFKLQYKTARIFIAEGRGSDMTVIVIDRAPDGVGNVPSDLAWKDDIHFFSDSPQGDRAAITFIAKTMKDLLKGQVAV